MSYSFLIVVAMGLTAFSYQAKKKIVFFGDSITQMGADRGGFISLLRDSLQKTKPNQNELIGAGIGGNKVYDLYLRFDDDVLAKKPDVVVMWVGVNDVWHKKTYGTGTDADKFVAFYIAMIKKLQDRNIKVIVCTPAVVGEKTDYTNSLDGELNQYSQLIRNLAGQYHCPLIDFRKIFHEYEINHNDSNTEKGVLTVDGVHLNAPGNQLVADSLFDIFK